MGDNSVTSCPKSDLAKDVAQKIQIELFLLRKERKIRLRTVSYLLNFLTLQEESSFFDSSRYRRIRAGKIWFWVHKSCPKKFSNRIAMNHVSSFGSVAK